MQHIYFKCKSTISNNFSYIGVNRVFVGLNSCLCTACFRAIEKKSTVKYLQKHACSIMSCTQSANHSFTLPWMNRVKKCYQNKCDVCNKYSLLFILEN